MPTAGLVETVDESAGGASGTSGMGDRTLEEKLAATDAPRIVIDTQSHTVVLTAFDLLMISTVALLGSSAILAIAEVFG